MDRLAAQHVLGLAAQHVLSHHDDEQTKVDVILNGLARSYWLYDFVGPPKGQQWVGYCCWT